jgi:hypothetical protein
MQTINFTAEAEDNAQIEAIKAFMKALKIKFKFKKESLYRSEFIEKIESGRKEYKQGKGEAMSLTDFKKLCK